MKVCVCCKARQSNLIKYFKHSSGKLSRVTLDHIVLKSLGGSSSSDNLNYMCEDCNTLRGNMFAEQAEFIAWYHSGEPMPSSKNFCYIREQTYKSNQARQDQKIREANIRSKVVGLPSKGSSELIKVDIIEDVVYLTYKHPTFGISQRRVK